MKTYGTVTPAGPVNAGHTKLPTTPRRDSDLDPFERLEQGRARQRVRGIVLLNPDPTPSRPAPPPKPKPKPRKAKPKTVRTGPPRRPGPTGGPAPATDLTWDVAEAAQLAADGWTAMQLADKYGVTPTTVRYQMKRRGVPLTNQKHAPRLDHQAMAAMAADGKTTTEIADALGCNRKTVWRTLRAMGQEVTDGRGTHSGGYNAAPQRMIDALVTGYTQDGLSATQAAAKAGLSLSAALRYLHQAGVPIRASSEVQTGRPGKDGAVGLRQLMDANNTTAADVRAWAAATGRGCPSVGTPSRALVEDYLTHNRTTTPRRRDTA